VSEVSDRWEYETHYIGDPYSEWGREQMNHYGEQGWEIVEIRGYDAVMKRRKSSND
jgi:hypothetical protein